MKLMLWCSAISLEHFRDGKEITAYATNLPISGKMVQISIPLEATQYLSKGRYTVLPKDKW